MPLDARGLLASLGLTACEPRVCRGGLGQTSLRQRGGKIAGLRQQLGLLRLALGFIT